ncbi:hypothetical protein ACWPKS_18845 [Coraliomargarita sp. W4R72]
MIVIILIILILWAELRGLLLQHLDYDYDDESDYEKAAMLPDWPN